MPGLRHGVGPVHSRYARRLADAAIGGRRLVIRLTVRRFCCACAACKRKTFAEQVPGLTARYARKTPLLAGMLRDIVVALAGRAASRLAWALGADARIYATELGERLMVGRHRCCRRVAGGA